MSCPKNAKCGKVDKVWDLTIHNRLVLGDYGDEKLILTKDGFTGTVFDTHIGDKITTLENRVDSLYQIQSSLVYPVWSRGTYEILKARQHYRVKLVDAYVVVGDNSERDITLELVGYSEPLTITSTYKSGTMKQFKLLHHRTEIPFWENLQVRAYDDRNVEIKLVLESVEV